jgi:hypothetical protein
MNRHRDDRNAEIPKGLRSCVLFRACSDDDLAAIVPLLAERTYAAGAVIVAEGEPATELFVVQSGEVEVTKCPEGGGQEYRLTTLGPGASFGELTVVDRGARSASVRALAPTTVAVLPMAALDRLSESDTGLRARVLHGLAAFLASRLRGVSEVTATALQRELELADTRARMGTFLTYVFFIMLGYSFALRFVSDMAKSASDTALVTIPILFGFAVPLYTMMRRSGEPIAFYGLTWRGAGAAARDALVWSIPMLLAGTALKAAIVARTPALAGVPVFAFGGFRDPAVPVTAAWFALFMSLAYVALVPLQEFIARGALQSPIARFLVGPHARLRAIVLADALFVASHLYLSTTFALLAMLPGLLWGWLYDRHGTLVAPVVSHALLGWWTLFVLGFDRLLV